jgi:hypothetical protein
MFAVLREYKYDHDNLLQAIHMGEELSQPGQSVPLWIRYARTLQTHLIFVASDTS